MVTTSNQSLDAQRAAANDARRSNKPIMEKRRRARINNCLNELKTLILDAMKKDPARHSKLEKADILEMTVRHLEALQRQRAAADPTVLNKFRAGFSECAGEVGRFPGLEPSVRRRLLQHLASCLASPSANQQQQNQSQTTPTAANIFLTAGTGLQLVPTRLPNGDIALVLPAQQQPPSTSPLPTLIPIPARTASSASASSTTSSTSSSTSTSTSSELSPASPEEAPLALVTRRETCDRAHDEDKPWRPW